MSGIKLLTDTNVVIGLEDAHPVQASFAEFVRVCSEHGVSLFVDAANYDDIHRDKDPIRRSITLSKLAKFQKLREIPLPSDELLREKFGAINNENDRSDVRLLATLDAEASDFLITEDNDLHRRAIRADLGSRVLRVEEALDWLRQAFDKKAIALPYVAERKAYEIDQNDTIFSSLRHDYPEFDEWFARCRRQHRDCWTLEVDGLIAGIVIRKDETHAEACTRHPGPKILKICTFKVSGEFQGEKFGELLLKQILWFAQKNNYDLVYLTAFPKQEVLVDLLNFYGFQKTKTLPNGEFIFEKSMSVGPLTMSDVKVINSDRKNYPRFHDDSNIRKFCVPIRPEYHRRLFPEIAFGVDLPLFPRDKFGPELIVDKTGNRTPGNTIRKVYLCRSKTKRLRPGDILFFYMSKDEGYAASQSITTIGVVENVVKASTDDELTRLTAKRSVFSASELKAMIAEHDSPIKVIDFLLIGHIDPFISLNTLVNEAVFSGRPPQSISEFSEATYFRLRPHIDIGFEF